MLHNLLRSLGRPSHTTRRLSRRKFTANGHRSETAIERLEERMLLSGTAYDEYSAVRLFGTMRNNEAGSGNETGFAGPALTASDSVVAAYIYWQGVDLINDGGDGVYDDSSITVNGSVVRGELLGESDSFGRGEGGSGAFRADVTGFMHSSTGASNRSTLSIAGMATKPGHRMDTVQFFVLYRSEGMPSNTIWLRTSGIDPPEPFSQTPSRAYTYYDPYFTTKDVAANLNFTVTYLDGIHQGTVLQGEGNSKRFDSYEIIQPPPVGDVMWRSGNNPFDYYAPAGFEGQVSFTYRVRLGGQWSKTATVNVSVVQQTSTNPPTPTTPPTLSTPTAADLDLRFSYIDGVLESSSMSGHGNWRRYHEYEIVSPPSVGEVVILPEGNDPFAYVPPVGFSGKIVFTYRVRLGTVWSTPATVRIDVAQWTSPVTADLSFSGSADEPLVGRLESVSARPHQLFELVGRPTVGTVSLDPSTGDFVFTPPRGFSGTAEFQYRTWDGLFSQASSVTLSIAPASPGRQADTQGQTAPAGPREHVGVRKQTSERTLKFYLALYASEQSVAKATPLKEGGSSKPAVITVVVMSTSDFDATELYKNTLHIERNTAGVTTDPTEPSKHDKPRKVTLFDVNGDGRDDLVAVFELDWADLRAGWALAVLTARTGWRHAHVDDVEPKKLKETTPGSSPSKSPITELPVEQDFNDEQLATPMLAAGPPKSAERSRPSSAGRVVFEPMSPVLKPPGEFPANQPVSSAAFIVLSTDTLDASRIVPSTVSQGRQDANRDRRSGEDGFSASFDEHRDVDDDDREDFVAVFEHDWAELWDGYKFAVLSR